MRFLITAGGTREYIDPVRFISNASSGKMGYALARAAEKAGHKVTLITAPTNLRLPAGVKVINVETSAQMFSTVKKHFEKCNCLIMAAAVADYVPTRQSKTKIKKATQSLTIRLKPTTDILKWAGNNRRSKQLIVGFALEDKTLRKNAEKKLKEKNLDMIIANRPSVIGSDKSAVDIKMAGCNWIKINQVVKSSIAKKIIRLIENSLAD